LTFISAVKQPLQQQFSGYALVVIRECVITTGAYGLLARRCRNQVARHDHQIHNSAIRQLYPEQKLTLANYKGFAARCEGLLCVRDMTKPETLQFFDKIISDYRVNIQFNAEVYGMRGLEEAGGARFQVESSAAVYESKVLACAIGIFGRPNKPKNEN